MALLFTFIPGVAGGLALGCLNGHSCALNAFVLGEFQLHG